MTGPTYLTVRTVSLEHGGGSIYQRESDGRWLAVIELDGVSETYIREAVTSGKLPAARFGKLPKPGHPDRRSIRIRREDLDAWVSSLMGGAE